MTNVLLAAAAVLALALPVAANAKDHPGDHPGNGHPHKGHADKGHHDRGHAAAQAGTWTPPGLAKKPHGMPPGQAKKMWSQGERLPDNYLSQRYYVADPSRYQLQPAPYGYRWVQVGDQYYLAQTQTGLISQAISALIR